MSMTKIIFSRKGFDSSAGGIPSSKRGEHLISFPIPYKKNTLTTFNHVGLGKDIKELFSQRKILDTIDYLVGCKSDKLFILVNIQVGI